MDSNDNNNKIASNGYQQAAKEQHSSPGNVVASVPPQKGDKIGGDLNPEKEPQKKVKNGKAQEQKVEEGSVSFISLFKYATTGQTIMIIIALILGVLHGAMMPIFSIVFGQITKDFTPTASPKEIRNTAGQTAGIMAALGIATYFFAGIGVGFWNYIGE